MSIEILEPATPIIISGTGKVSTLVAEAIKKNLDYDLLPITLTSDNINSKSRVEFQKRINLENLQFIPSCQSKQALRDIKERRPQVIIVDFTEPNAANSNAKLFSEVKIPFVMGTTGGDRQILNDTVETSEISAVIAPNMAPHIVIAQSMLDYASKKFPNALKEWNLEVTESHQKKKKDVSGTAKAFVEYFKKIGVTLIKPINSIRNPIKQLILGIRNFKAHGYHWFNVSNPNKTASIEIKTTVEGREPYVEGTLMAIKFLEEKVKGGDKSHVYSMIDVLEAQK